MGRSRKIPLSKGYHALVDAEDFARLNQFKWSASVESRGTKVYAIRWQTVSLNKRLKVRMHREILGLPPGPLDAEGRVVDHKNHDGLDNRKANLEIVTQEENMRRSPGWKKKGEEVAYAGPDRSDEWT